MINRTLSVYLKPDFSKTKDRAKNVQCALEYTTLRCVTQATEILLRRLISRFTCIFNDDNAEKLILRIRIINDEAPKGELQDEDDVFLKKIESNMLTESGIPNINQVFIKSGKVNKFDENEGFKPEVEWMLDTEGKSVIEVLGIEAVRQSLLDGLRVVISFHRSPGVNVCRRTETTPMGVRKWCAGAAPGQDGAGTIPIPSSIMAITCHGINRNDTRPMMRCSFEEMVHILLDVAVYAETDYLWGVTENIMLGQPAPIRTGDCALLLNEQ
ncbi:putative DNA-directed RNA polymerase [Helianthus annuus]|nr:putative DNA-directed RNA polymerase [Helianthus annuus]